MFPTSQGLIKDLLDVPDNLERAAASVPDGSKEPGIVAVATKRGYRLFERVIRPAEVGVTRAP